MKLISKKHIYMLALVVICLLMIVVVPTYAKFASNYDTEDDIVGLSMDFDLTISNIEEYEEVIVPAENTISFNVEVTNNTGDMVYYGIWYMNNDETELTDDVVIGRLMGTEVSTSDSIDDNEVVTASIGIINNSKEDIKINIGVSSSITGIGDIEYIGGKRLITGEVEVFQDITIAQFIKNLYNDGSFINTVNIGNDATKPEIYLNTVQKLVLDNNGEYRYYGDNPNNYVNFNGELWRIISVSNVKSSEEDTVGEQRVKIIRDEAIGNYSWDTNDSNGINDWSQADLMTELNTLYYNKQSGSCYNGEKNVSVVCDFSLIGLNDGAKDFISDALWYLGGSEDYTSLLANDYYNFERGTSLYGCNSDEDICLREATWTGIVGVMYPSDYLYATDLSLCVENSLNYSFSDCLDNNWLYLKDVSQWTISSSSGVSNWAFYVDKSGSVGNYSDSVFMSNAYAVRPVVYLNSDVMISGGEGTVDKPYLLK